MCEDVDVFPDELPKLPSQRVVDFGIELHPSTSPISMTPHRMAPVELQARNKISVITDISVLGFYGYIGNIGKYRWIF